MEEPELYERCNKEKKDKVTLRIYGVTARVIAAWERAGMITGKYLRVSFLYMYIASKSEKQYQREQFQKVIEINT